MKFHQLVFRAMVIAGLIGLLLALIQIATDGAFGDFFTRPPSLHRP